MSGDPLLQFVKLDFMIQAVDQRVEGESQQKDARSGKNSVENITPKNALHLSCHQGYSENNKVEPV